MHQHGSYQRLAVLVLTWMARRGGIFLVHYSMGASPLPFSTLSGRDTMHSFTKNQRRLQFNSYRPTWWPRSSILHQTTSSAFKPARIEPFKIGAMNGVLVMLWSSSRMESSSQLDRRHHHHHHHLKFSNKSSDPSHLNKKSTHAYLNMTLWWVKNP